MEFTPWPLLTVLLLLGLWYIGKMVMNDELMTKAAHRLGACDRPDHTHEIKTVKDGS